MSVAATVCEADVKMLALNGAEYETIKSYVDSHHLSQKQREELLNIAARYTM